MSDAAASCAGSCAFEMRCARSNLYESLGFSTRGYKYKDDDFDAASKSKTRLGFITRGYKSKYQATLPTPEAKELRNELKANAEKDSLHHVTLSMLILRLRTG